MDLTNICYIPSHNVRLRAGPGDAVLFYCIKTDHRKLSFDWALELILSHISK